MEQTPSCDKCGGPTSCGYEIRYYGEADPQTGYRDQERICNRCLDEVEADAEDYSDWMADMAYDLSEGA